jgi:26S proteasome regulatory subunit N1
MHYLWNIDEGLTKIDRFQHSSDGYVKSGAMMGIGLLSAGIKSEIDPAFALLTEHLDTANNQMRLGIINGLAFAYAGSYREDVLEILTPLVIDTTIPLEQSAMAALTLGLVFVGTCNNDVAESIA